MRRQAARRPRVLSLAAVAVLVIAAAVVACSAATTPANVPVVSEDCPVQWQRARAVIQGGGSPPRCEHGRWLFDLPAQTLPAIVRRSEVLVPGPRGEVVGREGATAVYDTRITAELGPAATGDRAWHVLWQLQGQVHGEWRGPSIGIQVRGGKVYLGGGGGHPKHDYTASNYEWRATLGDFRDGTEMHVRVVVTLSANPDTGTVDAWFNGHRVLTDWVPVSIDGHRPGTLYPGQPEVSSRIGLYRGSQGEAPPTYRQYVVQRPIEISAR